MEIVKCNRRKAKEKWNKNEKKKRLKKRRTGVIRRERYKWEMVSKNNSGKKKNNQNQLGPPNFVEKPPMPLPNMLPTFSTTFEVTLLI